MIAILSDFGHSEYLGVMKGVILSHSSKAQIVDLYNDVAPQNVREAAWILFTSCKYFPKKTVFLGVVDPGVGSERQAVAVMSKNFYFVGPDNGLFSPALEEDGIQKVVKLPVQNASHTFHGRDVFAEAAALLDKGVPMDRIGKKTTLKNKLSFHLKGRVGEIVRIDVFGNVITNIPHIQKRKYQVTLGKKTKAVPFYETYAKAPLDTMFLIEGSANTLEFALKNGSAAKKLKVRAGFRIKLS